MKATIFSGAPNGSRHGGLLALLAGVFVLGSSPGCQQKPAAAPSSEPPVIPVSNPVQRKVTDYVDFTGWTAAKETVKIIAQATGKLERPEKPFKEGSEVNEGDLLYQIDPRPYQAQVDQAQAQVKLSETQVELADATYKIDKSAGPAITQLQLDKDKAAVDGARARVDVAKATLETARTNLGYTTIRAPVSGRISSIFQTPGNLAVANQTVLTTIVSMDPMYALFDIDQRTHDRYIKALNERHIKTPSDRLDKSEGPESADQPIRPVQMGLENEVGFPWMGNIDFINNQINSSTGTVAVRGVFRNERPEGGSWRMIPGMYVRIRLPIGEPHSALLVIDRAIGSDQGLKFVYVLDGENKVQYRRVVTGSLQEDGLRVIEPYDAEKDTGLKPDDQVIIGGLPQLRPRLLIKPDPIAMPSLTNAAPTPDRSRPQPQSVIPQPKQLKLPKK